jgi:AAA+ ATPase superfamily predicted ATPase
MGEIINYCGLKDKTSLSPYLNKLILLDLIKKKFPIFSKRKKKAKYVLSDKYFSFWLRYIYRNMNFSEEKILSIIKKDFNRYLGKTFEEICKNIIKDNFMETGSWWHKDKEIDIIAYDDSKLVFGECKWKDNVDSEKICKELIEKIQYIDVPNNLKNHKKELWIFAKSFKSKIDQFEDYEVRCFDLKDLEKLINKS